MYSGPSSSDKVPSRLQVRLLTLSAQGSNWGPHIPHSMLATHVSVLGYRSGAWSYDMRSGYSRLAVSERLCAIRRIVCWNCPRDSSPTVGYRTNPLAGPRNLTYTSFESVSIASSFSSAGNTGMYTTLLCSPQGWVVNECNGATMGRLRAVHLRSVLNRQGRGSR